MPDEGIYLFLVSKEETREPDAEQRPALEGSAFSLWYSQQKAGFDISRDDAHHRPGELTQRGAGGPMLDALLAEARLRWGSIRPPASPWSSPSGWSPRPSSRRCPCWSCRRHACG